MFCPMIRAWRVTVIGSVRLTCLLRRIRQGDSDPS